MHYNWLVQNSKIKKMSGVKTYNWGIPAYQSKSGFRTCPNAAACAIGCYARQGAYTFSNVAAVFEKRLKLALSDKFIDTIDAEIKRRKIQRIRIHDSGDFFSIEYTQAWFEIMRRNPSVAFYAYTKQVLMFKDMHTLPENFTVVFSYGGTQDKLIDKADRHSTVFESKVQLKNAGYADASKNDSVALGSNRRIGLIYHGVKSYKNTYWNRVKT